MGSWLILAATLAAFEVPPDRALGGNALEFTQHIRELDDSGRQVRVTVPDCYSGCTFYLLAYRVCIAPYTRFHFHGPQGLDKVGTDERGLDQATIDQTIWAMFRNYEVRVPGLGDWFIENAAHLWGSHYAVLTGREIHARFHINYCR